MALAVSWKEFVLLQVAISFDYDSPAGYQQSFNIYDMPADADQKGTEALLRILSDYDVNATFGIVGQVALNGEPPEHCPNQIREIYDAGHEIASHSMTHRYLPSMDSAEMFADILASKQALESCIAAEVRGFIPPFNRPMHFPSKGAFSIAEVLGLHGRGRGKQSIETMLQVLDRVDFGWCRVSFEPKFRQVMHLLGITNGNQPPQPFVLHNVVAIPLHSTGFGEKSRKLIHRFLYNEMDLVLTIYGHPNQALTENEQCAKELAGLFAEFDRERARGILQFNTMGDIQAQFQSPHSKK